MKNEAYARLKIFLSHLKNIWNTRELTAEIYNLAQEQLISKEQEKELYGLLPDENLPLPSKLFAEGDRCIALYAYSLKL